MVGGNLVLCYLVLHKEVCYIVLDLRSVVDNIEVRVPHKSLQEFHN